MQKLVKTFLLLFLVGIGSTQYVIAKVKMNEQQAPIVKQLKKQGILPNKTYYQLDYLPALDNEDRIPNKTLYPSLSHLETIPEMYIMAMQSIAQVQLNENYQYSKVLRLNRNIIEVIYPTDSFQSLDDGVYFYTLDENKQLQPKGSFNEVYKLPCYLRVEKKHGIVVSIQKRGLASISRYIYDYWHNTNLKYLKIEKYDTKNNIIYDSEVFFDDKGEMVKAIRKNTKTGLYSIENIIHQGEIYSINEFFDNEGNITNRVTNYENTSRVKNEVLNKNGKVIKTNNAEPEIFDFDKDLDESYPYNKLVMNVEKSNALLTDSMFEQGIRDNPKYDEEALKRVQYLGIKPKQVYYHKLPFPSFMAGRYKNYPHQAPLTLIEAENQSPQEKYSDLIKVEIDNNYQYKKIDKTKWQQAAIFLPSAQLKSLENGIHFFVINNKGQLTPLNGAEEAIAQPTYVRVEKVMGKIVSTLQKNRVQWLTTEFDYKKNSPIRSKLTVIESHVVPKLVIESEYESGQYLPVSQVIKNAQGNIIRTYKTVKKKNIIAILERFDEQGVKTNHIEISKQRDIENQYFDNKKHVRFTTSDIQDKEHPQLYDELPFNPDGFEMMLFEHFKK
ncbi:hypothetical protein [Gilliamella apis]|uniref:hypothetical protein n=2 Tax=Gilliamella TaxID=1193503 RepID=UPI00080E10F1|nr:hypothetical protein [Gilliamella apis]OCG09540.1 hypothetical protein A9G15_00315 [Gilliamella apis]OTQ62605.1 hypothetical protein B6C98_01975 [Gilliamella apis]OTQ65729.1 hypothetical protein B6D09_01525 [Gilliamella apis]OTQ68353.1 hypothetical protein B6C89_01345 [Gilliamella apis]OTQ70058.1 hypothetical protein B6D10_01890 [Gilliamella apis]